MNSIKTHSPTNLNLPHQYDVLVVGAGAAGLYAALCLPENLQVGLISKEELNLSASDWAQGGIAAAIAPEDSPQLHIEDTLKAGAGLCDLAAVQFLAEHAPEGVKSLLNLGVRFDHHDGHLALTLEAAHSRRRVLHAADTTGRAVVGTLTAQALNRPNIQVIPQAIALSLWLNPQTGHCQGLSLLYGSQVLWVQARAVIMATGGGGQVFAQTTNPSISTGDGVAIAWRAGAILRDLEFVQFHPTALTKAGAPRFLISEAVRGEGAYLIDDQGHRFVFDYHPAGELAPRDVVSRAIFTHFQHSNVDPALANVWLDLRPIPPERIRHRFPNIIQVCRQWGIDVFSQPVPVAPAAHYWMGGILTNLTNQTSLPGLYAVGETTSTGVHGANRLASNSLLECIVFGAKLANLQLESGPSEPAVRPEPRSLSFSSQQWATQQAKIAAVREELPRLVWQSAGICRGQAALESAIAKIQLWQAEIAALPLSEFFANLPPGQAADFAVCELPVPENKLAKSDPSLHLDSMLVLRSWAEINNLLDIAYLILQSAAFRTESRGGHYRKDYPQTDPNWQVHTLIQHHRWWTSPVNLKLAQFDA